MTPAEAEVRAAIARRGPLPFDQVVELALYGPSGFYTGGGRAGRRGDFLTSPEVGFLFGAVVARALDRWWDELGRPATFTVVEVGAGPGALARSVLAAEPACAPALRYALVERSPAQRSAHRTHLAIEAPEAAFAGVQPPAGEDDALPPPPPAGPIVVSLAGVPRVSGPCVVLANELLDNLPFGLHERTADGWAEVRVGLHEDRLVEELAPLPGEPATAARIGARRPVMPAAAAWVHDALELAGPGGRVVAVDYASTTEAMVQRPWTDWVRTYRGHHRGAPPLEALGEQDITCEVAMDQLPRPSQNTAQADWLRAHGIDDLVEAARATWRKRASIGDLEAVRARSRASEADALLDPTGLGAFRVLEWLPPPR